MEEYQGMQIRKRILMADRATIYHVMSRTAYQSFLFDEEAKGVFTRMLFHQAAFAGIDVLGYCIMSNHIHLLIRVSPIDSIPDTSLLERYKNYYGEIKIPQSSLSFETLRQTLKEGGSEAELARQRVLSRMGDLPAFMRELKQRFTLWYNHKHNNKGTIWAARYKSLIVEDSPESLTRVAAYIDLNPVRAEIVEDPKDYRWCGYAACHMGNRLMKEALIQLFCRERDYSEALKSYRLILFGKGYQSKGKSGSDQGRISADVLGKVVRQGGHIPLHELLRVRIRYFSDGLVMGTQPFVETVFKEHRSTFGPKRLKAGSPLPASNWGSLHTMRNLQRRVYSSSIAHVTK